MPGGTARFGQGVDAVERIVQPKPDFLEDFGRGIGIDFADRDLQAKQVAGDLPVVPDIGAAGYFDGALNGDQIEDEHGRTEQDEQERYRPYKFAQVHDPFPGKHQW